MSQKVLNILQDTYRGRLIKNSIQVCFNLITFPHDQFAFIRLHNVTKASQSVCQDAECVLHTTAL